MKRDGLNLIPFIDIMLVLLAIVLSISTFIAQSKIPVNLPKTTTGTPLTPQKRMIILVNAKNQIFIDDAPVNFQDLRAFIARTPADTQILIKNDKDSSFGIFAEILDALKAKNHENFAIATQKS